MKNFLRVTVLAICTIFMVANVSAQVITAERASEIANQFFANGKQKSAAFRSTNATLTQSIDSRAVTGESNDAPTFHILTGADGKGFVIVSGEETENPIIGYSFDGTIDTNNLPDGFVDYMTDIDAQVRALRKYNAANPQKAAARSAMQKAADYEYNATSMGNIVKNLNTAPWGQHGPFNNLCKTTDGQTALTGCGPTAFAILCYYYKWPASGVGTVTHQGTGENMELGHTYDYASMLHNYSSGYTTEQADAVALLMRDLGWANQVGYGTSSTSFSETGQHMVDHFRFKSERPVDHGASLAVVRSTLGNDTQWKTYIKNCLDAGYPIPYASTTNTSNSARHIYILDGYTDNDYYHFNWGWSGSGNGWFTLDNMVPDDYSNYSNSHKAYFNLIPDATTYTVTATATPSNMGTVSINGGTAGSTATADLLQGVTATLTANPAAGYALVSWTKNGVVVGSRNTIEVTVGTDANEYVANFDDEANVLVVKDYVVNTTNGSLNNGSNKSSIWTSTDNQPTLTLKTTADNDVVVEGMSVSSGNHKFYATAYDVNVTKAYTNVTYTLSVPEGYVIKDYTMTYIVGTANQISLNGELLTSTGTFELSATPNAQTASFTLSVSSAGQQYITSKSIAVTVQSEGGASTPTPDPEPEPDPTPTTYNITAEASPQNAGNVAINGGTQSTVANIDATSGSTVSLQAYPNSDYEFVGWYNGTTKVSSDNPYSITATAAISYIASFQEVQQGGSSSDDLAGKYFRLKVYNDTRYMNVKNHTEHTQKVTAGGVNIAAKVEDSNAQIFFFEQSGNGYMLKDGDGYYIKGLEWSVDASSTTSGSVLLFEETAIEDVYYIKWYNTYKGDERYFKIGADSNGAGDHPYCDVAANQKETAAAKWVLEEVVMQKVYIKAEIENWRNDNPNTHLGTITIGGTAMKLTPAHQTASELTMPVVEGTTLAFTRKYRGFEFNGFYIGATSLGTNPTLTADNVAAINETTPLVAKFTATDNVTLFYDDDEFSYRIPAIVKTVKDDKHKLIAISDYRHSFDDIGRDNHQTGTTQVDLVIRTSEDNGATWTAKQTIAEGSQHFGYGDAAAVANGQDVLVMAVAGNVFYAYANSENPQQAYRIYSNDNGVTWEKEDISSNMESLFPDYHGLFFGSGKLAVDPDFNGSGNARVYGAILMKDSQGERNYVLYSDNWGKTWNILGNAVAARQNEPKVEILPNGQILLSARRGGGRTFNVFTYTDKANNAGTWNTATNGCDNGGNGTNGEIILLDAKRPNGTPTKILLQSQPYGSDRRNVSIWYKEISANETYTASSIASGWTMGKQVSTQLSAYSAMCLQENGEIALFFEEAPCYADDYTKGYSMVYVPLTIEEITENNFLNPDAVVETVTVDVTLTDEQGNTYTHQFDYLPGDAAAIDAALTTAYPFITLGAEGNLQGSDTYYTYTNTVTLPFKVSNANTTVWHNIYFPANGTSAGEYYPIYLMAENENATAVAKITEKVHYGNSQYNTYNYADKLAWAVYNVNEGFTFKFKNKLTGKFMAVTGVSSDNTNNVVYTDEAGATAFTLEKYTGGNASYGNYAIKSVYNSTTGYVCNTSVGYTYATNYPGTGHAGAWVKFVESPDYWTIYNQLIADINNFGTGDGKYTENDDINNIDIKALASMLFSDLTAQATAVQTVKESYREVVLTVNDTETATVPGSVSITVNGSDAETVNNKFVPANATVSILATANPGYRFVNWTRPAAQASAAARTAEARNSDVVSDQNPYTVTVSEALNLEANFEEIVVNATLTDAQGNTYEVQLSGFTTEITKDAVAEKLREAYPYITLGSTDQNGDVIDFGALNIDGTAYTYTNRVELPFKVTNTTYLWHNIYWPSNTKNNDWPVYLSASTADDVYVPKVTGSYAYGDHPTYNTKSGNDKISWAIYNVNNGFEFIFKNKVTQKYIRIRNVADKDAQNVQYVENAEDATAFTIEMKPEGQTYDTDAKYALAAMFGETKGYLCSTSATGYNYATHYNSNEHQGAWIEFKESPDYFSKIMDLGIVLGLKFGAGDGKYIITDEISVIDNDIANNSDNITLNTLNEYASTIEDAMNNWPAVGLTIYPAEGGTTNINGEENVVHKYVPNGYKLPLAAVPAEGYHFVSWTDGTSEIETVEYTKTISGGKGDVIELTANFAKNSYTVNVSTNGTGGSATASATTVEHGSEVTLTAEANDGYEFAGWYNGEVLVSAEANYTFTVTSDINYTARFNEVATGTVAIRITVASTDGTTVTNDVDGNVKAIINNIGQEWATGADFVVGADVELVATNDYDQKAYLFDGWYKNGNLVSEELAITVHATEVATYEARFFRGCVVIGEPKSDRIGYVTKITLPDGTSLGYDASNRAVVKEGTEVMINTWLSYGYETTWKDENDNIVGNEQNLVITIERDVTYTATFEPASYDLTVRANDDNYGTVSATSGTSTGTNIKVGHNMEATITATANPGYYFVNWTKGTDVVSSENPYTIPGIADVKNMEDAEYIANFLPVEDATAGVYYRIGYDGFAAAAAGAARAATDETHTYIVSPNTGTPNDAGTFSGSWTYTKNGAYQADLTMVSTSNGTSVNKINTMNNGIQHSLAAYYKVNGVVYGVTYTVSVPENGNYKIAGYSIGYTAYQNVTVNSTATNHNNTGSIQATGLDVYSFDFTVSSTSSSGAIDITNFEVYIQQVDGGAGTPETPEPETPANRYYIQSEACGVSGGNNLQNALKMTQKTGAASIFYYADSKLLSYDKGQYIIEDGGTRGLQAVGVSGTVTITTSGETATISAPNYMHANTNGTTYYADHCGSNTGTAAHANHNFVLEEVTTLPVTISSALHATFYAPVAVEIPEGVKAYVLKAEDIPSIETYAWMTSLKNGIIPANTGVIIKGAEGTYYFDIVENNDAARAEAVGNVLSGTVAKTKITHDAYILANREGKIGLYPVAKNSYLDNNTNETTVRFTNNSHKAYLPVTNDWFGEQLKLGTGFRFVYDDEETTGIDEFETELEDTIYDLQGRKLSEITEPGIYIVNGKKIFVK